MRGVEALGLHARIVLGNGDRRVVCYTTAILRFFYVRYPVSRLSCATSDEYFNCNVPARKVWALLPSNVQCLNPTPLR